MTVVVVLNCSARGKMLPIPSEEVKSGTKAAKQYIATKARELSELELSQVKDTHASYSSSALTTM
jgi:hypothetical protein